MPTAAVAKLEKQGSLDANDPLRQGIIMVEHKIRNLEKRKLKLDGYRDLQKTGKDLNTDQLEAISKYDAVIQHLEFAKELSKHLTTLAIEAVKNTKKQARKDAQEKTQQDIARTKEIIMMQDVLSSMGQEAIREDFVQGKGKMTLTIEELQQMDDLYVELAPKRDKHINYEDMFQGPAEVMNNLIEGKNKEVAGTTYSALKIKLLDIAKSGYFDNPQPEPEPPVIEEEPVEENHPVAVSPVPAVEEAPVVTCTFQQSHVNPIAVSIQPAQHLPPLPQQPNVTPVLPVPVVPMQQPEEIRSVSSIETAYFTPSHLRVFQSGTIDFMQDNELDTPDHVEAPPSIPTMTYTNQSFTPMESSQPAPAVISPAPQTEPPQVYQNQTDEEKGWSHVGNDNHQPNPTSEPVVDGDGWPETFDSTPVVDDSSWATQAEEQWTEAQPAPQHNDGFITQGGRGRGGRGRGGGDRNQKGGNYNSGRGGNRGGNRVGYNNRDGGGYNNRDGGFGGGGNYKEQNNYQNGYQNRNGRGRSGGPPTDRQGGGRGRGGGGNRPSGGYRGGNTTGGGFRQQQQQQN